MGHIGPLYRSIVEKHVSYIFVTLNNYSPDLGKPCDAIYFRPGKYIFRQSPSVRYTPFCK